MTVQSGLSHAVGQFQIEWERNVEGSCVFFSCVLVLWNYTIGWYRKTVRLAALIRITNREPKIDLFAQQYVDWILDCINGC